MRRTLILATLAAASLLAASCGVTADTTAATVSGRDVPIEDVTALVEDEVLMEVVFGMPSVDDDESTQPGDVARQALLFEIERVAWAEELDRWGLELTQQDRDAAAAQLDAELQGAGVTEQRRPTDRNRELLVDYLAARNVLSQRLAQIDVADDTDLRRLYEGSASLWDRVCMVAVRFTPDRIGATERALDDGVAVEELTEVVERTELVADPTQRCVARSELPGELRDAVDTSRVGSTSSVVLVDDGAGGRTGFVFRVDERQTVGFEEARPQLEGIVDTFAQQGAAPWVQLQVAAADIDPRYGSGVGAGGSGGLAIIAPPAPPASLSQLITAAEAAAAAVESLPVDSLPVEPTPAPGAEPATPGA